MMKSFFSPLAISLVSMFVYSILQFTHAELYKSEKTYPFVLFASYIFLHWSIYNTFLKLEGLNPSATANVKSQTESYYKKSAVVGVIGLGYFSLLGYCSSIYRDPSTIRITSWLPAFLLLLGLGSKIFFLKKAFINQLNQAELTKG